MGKVFTYMPLTYTLSPSRYRLPVTVVALDYIHTPILTVVDYFSTYKFATATSRADGETVVNFLKGTANVVGRPKTIYCDNASYFVKGVVPGELKEKGTLLFPAPITNPPSVGLAEKYVHLLMTGLRTALQGKTPNGAGVSADNLERWDE